MYATWFNFGLITEEGAKKEVVEFQAPEWSNVKWGYVNRGDVSAMSSPVDALNLQSFNTVGHVSAPWARAYGSYGARPALFD